MLQTGIPYQERRKTQAICALMAHGLGAPSYSVIICGALQLTDSFRYDTGTKHCFFNSRLLGTVHPQPVPVNIPQAQRAAQ